MVYYIQERIPTEMTAVILLQSQTYLVPTYKALYRDPQNQIENSLDFYMSHGQNSL